MKRHIYTQVDYNLWANTKITELLSTLDSDVIYRPISNSFPTINETLKHLYYAESIWLQRIQLDEHKQIPWPDTDPTTEELFSDLIYASRDLKNFINKIDKDDLGRTVSFITGEGSVLSNTLEKIIYHVINHSTYHRGQVITMLKQLGIKKAVSTDLYFYYQKVI